MSFMKSECRRKSHITGPYALVKLPTSGEAIEPMRQEASTRKVIQNCMLCDSADFDYYIFLGLRFLR